MKVQTDENVTVELEVHGGEDGVQKKGSEGGGRKGGDGARVQKQGGN